VDEYGGNMEIDGNIQGGAPKIAKLVYNYNNLWFLVLIEGSLEVKLPTIWTVEKQR
jgi:hypothetical protein